MDKRKTLMHETEGLIASDLQEVLDFVRFKRLSRIRDGRKHFCLANPVCKKIGLGQRKDEA